MIHRLRRPARLALVSVLPACDSLLSRRPIGRYRATSKIERIRTLDPWSEVGLPSQPHQLTTERGYISGHVLTESRGLNLTSASQLLLRGDATSDSWD